MYFDLKKEKMKLKKQYVSDGKIMLAAGMDEKDIRELYLHDLRQLYRYYQFYACVDNDITPEQELRLADYGCFDIMFECLQQILDELKPEQREIILLHIVEGLSLQEIAYLLDESETTVKSRFNRSFKEFSDKVYTILG